MYDPKVDILVDLARYEVRVRARLASCQASVNESSGLSGRGPAAFGRSEPLDGRRTRQHYLAIAPHERSTRASPLSLKAMACMQQPVDVGLGPQRSAERRCWDAFRIQYVADLRIAQPLAAQLDDPEG
jgi:hypothetical protein